MAPPPVDVIRDDRRGLSNRSGTGPSTVLRKLRPATAQVETPEDDDQSLRKRSGDLNRSTDTIKNIARGSFASRRDTSDARSITSEIQVDDSEVQYLRQLVWSSCSLPHPPAECKYEPVTPPVIRGASKVGFFYLKVRIKPTSIPLQLICVRCRSVPWHHRSYISSLPMRAH